MMNKSIAIKLVLVVVVLIIGSILTIAFFKIHAPNSQLLDAAEDGDLAKVKSLIQQGTPLDQTFPNKFGWSPLIAAIFHNQTNVVQYLIESGANVNLSDKNGETPLMWATGLGDEGVLLVNYLIAHQASLDAKDKFGATVFDYAQSEPPKPKLIETLKAAKQKQNDFQNKIK